MRRFAAFVFAVSAAIVASLSAAASQGRSVSGVLLDSSTSQPLAGFLVTLTPDSGGSGQTVRTSGNGQFIFPTVVAGKYILSGSGPGYRAQGLNQHENFFTGVAVGPELDSTHIVFRMQADASIRGQVLDEHNEPVRNATAQLFRAEEVNGTRRAVAVTNAGTNDQGAYHFSHLSPGMYYVGIAARPWYAQYAPQSMRGVQQQLDSDTAARARQENSQLDVAYPLTFYPEGDDSSQASAIILRPGERFNADIIMRAVPTVHLKIRSDRTAPGPGAPSIMQRVFDTLLVPVFASQGYGYAQGIYEFGGLAPGRYAVEVPGTNEQGSGRGGWFRDIELYNDMEISAADSPAMASVTGLITYEGSAAPRDVPYLELRNQDTGDSWSDKVSEKGLFGLKDNEIRPGRYEAVLYGAPDWIITKIAAQNAKVEGTDVTLAPGAPARLVCTATRIHGGLKGVVLKNGEPFPGALVLLVPDQSQDKQRYRRDESDSDGTFSLLQVVPGRYVAVAIQNGWDLEWGNPEVLRPYLAKGEKITVSPDKSSNLRLEVQ